MERHTIEVHFDNVQYAAAVEATLHEIFQSAPFRASRQCQELMRYITSRTLTGEDQLLRERVIGMEVFGRKPDYDTGEDPVVRLRASELRKRLAQFYQSDAGKAVPVQISMPSGSYRANFMWQSTPLETSVEPQPVSPRLEEPVADMVAAIAEQPAARDIENRWVLWPGKHTLAWLAAVGSAFLLFAGSYSLWERHASPLNQFWGPLLADPHPTLVCMGSNAVYRLSNNFLTDYEQRTGETHDGMEFLIKPVAGEKMDQRDLLRANNSFVALGDVAAASDFASFLGQRGKSFTERFPADMSFAEIQEYSSVLIGGFNNQMALTITKDLPFVMKGSNRIEERSYPQRNWRLQFYGDAHDSEDYALISRLIDPATRHEVVTLGGIGQYGTQAAADFLTNPENMKAWAAGMPKGWSQKNLQVILHVKVINYRPVVREVVASKVW